VSIVMIRIPQEIEKYSPLLQDFFDGMIEKLRKNAHKETPTKESLERIMELLALEIIEFEEQLAADKFDENSLIELMDQANFSFLAYVALRLQGVEHANRTGLPPICSEEVGDT